MEEHPRLDNDTAPEEKTEELTAEEQNEVSGASWITVDSHQV
jgi:hypothetical protein